MRANIFAAATLEHATDIHGWMLPRLKVEQRRTRPDIVSRVLATQRFNTVLAEVALRCRSCDGTFGDLAKGQCVVANGVMYEELNHPGILANRS